MSSATADGLSMRAAGASVWLALAAGAVLPAAGTIAGLVRHRSADPMGLLIVGALLLSAVLSLATGSPRALLARDGILTAAWAAYMYASMLAARQRLPQFRRIWQVCTVVWGTAILADAVIRVIMAATLPLGIVPGLNGALWPVTFVILQVVTNVYFYQSGFWRILRDGAPEPALEPDGAGAAAS